MKPILIVMLGLFVAFAFVAFAGDKNPQSGMTSSQTHFVSATAGLHLAERTG
jgi:hypothetical protein